MAGVNLVIDPADLERLTRRISQWAKGNSLSSVHASIGAEVETQTRRRIEEERTDPDGKPWQEWSEDYAKTRHGNHALLQNEGDLLDSIAHVATAQGVEVGTNIVYGATHQFGRDGRGIPARPYLGLSQENAKDVLDVIEDWVDQQIRRLS